MERIYALIERLAQQKAERASPAQLLATTQLLQQELLNSGAKPLGTAKVAVRLPHSNAMRPMQQEQGREQKEKEKQKEVVQEQPVRREEPKPTPTPLPYAPVEEIPTLVHQAPIAEVHERIVPKSESLNDRLKEQKTELGQSLKDAPIRDLKKGIGINDRFSFVNELFRGDEPMYERSIKTINGFNILSEAEYWMSRELKLKLGWNDTNETVQHFYSLVRRRFS